MIAKISVSAANYAIDKAYSYAIPEGMDLKPGIRVSVPFGRGNRPAEGVVLSVEPGQEEGLKPIRQRLDEEPLVSDTMLRLAAFLRERYFCTFYDAVRTMLPAGLWFQVKEQYALTEDRSWQENPPRQKDGLTLLRLLLDCGGQAEGTVLKQTMPEEDFQKAVSYLLRKKWITAQQDISARTKDKSEEVATLAVPSQEALDYAATRPKSAAQQRSVLELMCSIGSASVKEICYYTGAKPGTVRRLAELGFLELSQRPVLRCREIRPAEVKDSLILNAEQQTAFEGLMGQMEQEAPGAALLYGITGSGKTAVYIQLIRACLNKGKQAILLVPEIALTPQLLGVMAAYFGDQVAVLHSSLPAAERYDQWKRVRTGQASVVVGTRSAVFAPCGNLGLVILDEEQEHSYKSENAPRYGAKEVALWRGLKERALVVLGSATPSIETMYYAQSGRYGFYQLKERYNGKPLPKVEIVDMKQEVREGNDLSISYPLQNAITEARANGKQSILFLNRRGNSRALVCVECGQAPECPRCSQRLTYHSANERLMCHYCGHSQKAAERCTCGGSLKRIGTGTQKVQQELYGIFGDMPVDRMDADTVSATNTHEKILEHFANEKVPVLIGTQMVTKGLNLKDVTLVGVLDGDLSLYSGGYRGAETTFNMLTQVVGRAGRGDTEGRAIIQTMVPEHKVITLAAQQDYDSFYEMELGMRRVQNLPPFGDVATVTFVGQNEAHLMRGAVKFRDSLQLCLKEPDFTQEICTVLGPAPCPVAKINYNYRYRLTLRCRMTKPLRQLLGHLLRQFSLDKANRGVTAFVDVNGYD
jgi:primosomal protein N' (replication factor Y)